MSMMQRLSSAVSAAQVSPVAIIPSSEEAAEQKATLFRNVSDAIKEVQRRFHGKHEMATATDSSVSCLCTTLETIFLHGLKPPRKRGGEHAFWPLLNSILTDDDAASLSMLKNISTDSGRGRAWIRWALNERSLEKYLNMLTGPSVFASGLYYDFAFLCDEDQMSMLTMLVVGIESIVFAVEVDAATLDKVNDYSSNQKIKPKEAAPKQSYDQTPAAFVNPESMDPMALVEQVKKTKKSKSKRKKRVDRTPDIGSLGGDSRDSFNGYPSRSQSLDLSTAPWLQAASQTEEDPSGSSSMTNPGDRDGTSSSLQTDILSPPSAPIDMVSPQSAPADSFQSADSSATTGDVGDKSITTTFASQPLSTESAFDAIDQMLASKGIMDDLPTGSGDGIYEDMRSPPPIERSPSPATIAKMALEASRNPSLQTSTKASPTDASTDLNQDDLRHTLMDVIRSKEILEKENESTKADLNQVKMQLQELEREKAGLCEQVEEFEQRLSLSGENRSQAEQIISKENLLLKQQLKKYVAENQQLKRSHKELLEGKDVDINKLAAIFADSAAPSVETVQAHNHNGAPTRTGSDSASTGKDDDESIEGYASIEDMQAHHERQILQLTEMHGELIDMNERLQEQLAQRNRQIQSLGGVVPSDSFQTVTSRTRHNTLTPSGAKPARLPPPPEGSMMVPGKNIIVNVWIPSALLRGRGSESFHVYQIYIRVGDDEWNVYRRFTHFVDLHRQVQHIFAGTKIPFPQKKMLNRKGSKFVEDRRQALEVYIRKVVQMCLTQQKSPMVRNPCKRTFCDALPFLKEKLSGVPAMAKPRPQSAFGDL